MNRLPIAYIDNVRTTTATGLQVINRDPETDETRVPADTLIRLEIADLAGAGVSLAATQVSVGGVLAFDAGTFETGFQGAGSAYTNVGLSLVLVIEPEDDLASRAVVPVHVVSDAVGGGQAISVTYSFTVQDTDGLQLDGVLGWAQQVVRVFYDYAVDPELAGNPGNYAIVRQNVFPACAVNVQVVGARIVSDSVIDLDLDIPITPGAPYLLTISNVRDVDGWPFYPPANARAFAGWAPPTVVGRSFNIYGWFGTVLRQQDQEQRRDMEALLNCWQEVFDLVIYNADRWNDINDPRTAPEKFVIAGLYLMGNPFAWAATEENRRRRLLENLVGLYKLKGTDSGIIAALRLLMDLDVTVEPYNRTGWRLGRSRLGRDTRLAIGSRRGRLSFDIYETAAGIGRPGVNRVLTAAEEAKARRIVAWIKPVNMHLINVRSPFVP